MNNFEIYEPSSNIFLQRNEAQNHLYKIVKILPFLISAILIFLIDLRTHPTMLKCILIIALILPIIKLSRIIYLILNTFKNVNREENGSNRLERTFSSFEIPLKDRQIVFLVICSFISLIIQLCLFKNLLRTTGINHKDFWLTITLLSLSFALILFAIFNIQRLCYGKNSSKLLFLILITIADFICIANSHFISYKLVDQEPDILLTVENDVNSNQITYFAQFAEYTLDSHSTSDLEEMTEGTKSEIKLIEGKIYQTISICEKTTKKIEKIKFKWNTEFENVRSVVSDFDMNFLFEALEKKAGRSTTYKLDQILKEINNSQYKAIELKNEFSKLNIENMTKYETTFTVFGEMGERATSLLTIVEKCLMNLDQILNIYESQSSTSKLADSIQKIVNSCNFSLSKSFLNSNEKCKCLGKDYQTDSGFNLTGFFDEAIPSSNILVEGEKNSFVDQNTEMIYEDGINSFKLNENTPNNLKSSQSESTKPQIIPEYIDFILNKTAIENLILILEDKIQLTKEIETDYQKTLKLCQIDCDLLKVETIRKIFDLFEFRNNANELLSATKDHQCFMNEVDNHLFQIKNEKWCHHFELLKQKYFELFESLADLNNKFNEENFRKYEQNLNLYNKMNRSEEFENSSTEQKRNGLKLAFNWNCKQIVTPSLKNSDFSSSDEDMSSLEENKSKSILLGDDLENQLKNGYSVIEKLKNTVDQQRRDYKSICDFNLKFERFKHQFDTNLNSKIFFNLILERNQKFYRLLSLVDPVIEFFNEISDSKELLSLTRNFLKVRESICENLTIFSTQLNEVKSDFYSLLESLRHLFSPDDIIILDLTKIILKLKQIVQIKQILSSQVGEFIFLLEN